MRLGLGHRIGGSAAPPLLALASFGGGPWTPGDDPAQESPPPPSLTTAEQSEAARPARWKGGNYAPDLPEGTLRELFEAAGEAKRRVTIAGRLVVCQVSLVGGQMPILGSLGEVR